MYAVGVDIGATWTRICLGDENKGIIRKVKIRTPTTGDNLTLAKTIIKAIREVCGEHIDEIEGIGIGSIGPLDIKRGILLNPPNIPFKEVPIVKPIMMELRKPVYLVNDCVAAVWGEKNYGEGKNYDNIVYITISTGIGCGAIVDGHLLLGKDGNAHEVGHITVDYTGRLKCGCGRYGHWEAYCSGKNIPKYARIILESEPNVKESILYKITGGDWSRLTAKMIYDAAKKGDKLALKIVEEIGKINAAGIASVINAYDPELLTLGGSVVLNNIELTIPYIEKYLDYYLLNRKPVIKVTKLGEDIVLYGALALVFNTPEHLKEYLSQIP